MGIALFWPVLFYVSFVLFLHDFICYCRFVKLEIKDMVGLNVLSVQI